MYCMFCHRRIPIISNQRCSFVYFNNEICYQCAIDIDEISDIVSAKIDKMNDSEFFSLLEQSTSIVNHERMN